MIFKDNFSKKKKEDKGDSIVKKVVNIYDNHPLMGREHMAMSYYLGFYNGHQYIKLTNDNIQAMNENDDGGIRQRSKINQLKPFTNINVSKFVRDLPNVSGIPTGNSERDRLAARAATKLLKHAFDQNQRNLIADLYSVLLWANLYGTGYWYIFWNDNLYRKVRTKDEKTGQESIKEQMKGDWDLKVKDPFEVYPDASAKEFKDLRYLIDSDYIDIDDAKALYKDKLKDKEIQEVSSNEIEDKRYAYVNDYYSNNSVCKSNMCHRLKYWEKPSENFPKGRLIVILNKNILAFEGDNPNAKYGELFSIPYFPFWWDKNAASFHGNSAIADAIPIQKEINALASIIMLNARVMASTNLALPRGWGVKKSDILGSTCNIVEYNPSFGATPITFGGNSIPGFVPGHLSMLMGAAQDSMGVHEVSQAQLPEHGSRLPASALKMLMDSEMVRHAPSMRLMQKSLVLSSNFILKLIKDKYKEERYLNIMGDGYKYETQAFINSDLDGSFDVVLQVTSGINSSPSAKVESLLSLFDRQIPQLAAQGDKASQDVMRTLEFGDTEQFFRKEQMYRARTEWWFQKLVKERKAPMIYDVDNIEMMLEKLTEYILSEEFQDEDQKFKEAILSAKDKLMESKNAASQGAPASSGQQSGGEGNPVSPTAPGQTPPMGAMDQASAMGGGEGMPPPTVPQETVAMQGQQ